MINLLRENPLILLFLVVALGHGIGRIKIKKAGLGSMATLLVGLGFGALSPDFAIPSIIFSLSLALYIYTLGLEYGSSFFASFGVKRSVEAVFLALTQVLIAAIVFFIYLAFQLDSTMLAGMFAGVVVNAASLASLIDIANNQGLSTEAIIVGFSLSFPMSVFARMAALSLMSRMLNIDYAAEALALRKEYPIDQQLETASILVKTNAFAEQPIRYLLQEKQWNVVFGRLYRQDSFMLISGESMLQESDILTLAGSEEDIDEVSKVLGERIILESINDMTQFQRRRIFVTNAEVVGVSIASLNIRDRYGATITRVQRGDDDFLANADFVLELGDRVRVLARPKDMESLVALFGDSYEGQNKLNLLTLGLGLGLGVFVGGIRFGLSSNLGFELGIAGGCLLVSLVLGSLRRTGALVWTQALGANHTIRQFSVAFFLATVGIGSGFSFFSTLFTMQGLVIMLIAILIGFVTSVLSLLIGFKLLKIPFSLLSGMVVSHPSALSYAESLAGNQLPTVGFTYAIPVSIMSKIIIAQLLMLSML